MENEFLSNVTLEYLMNKEQYAKYIEQNKPANKDKYQKEKKFYKKRIYDFTKKMLNGEKIDVIIPDTTFAFENYARSCIEYFKALDKTDILQEDYLNLDTDSKFPSSLEMQSSTTLEEANEIVMRSFKVSEPNSLEKIVKRKQTQIIAKAPVLPKQKDVNLKDPALKKKGIEKKNDKNVKKNNIIHMYGDDHQKKDENEENTFEKKISKIQELKNDKVKEIEKTTKTQL